MYPKKLSFTGKASTKACFTLNYFFLIVSHSVLKTFIFIVYDFIVNTPPLFSRIYVYVITFPAYSIITS